MKPINISDLPQDVIDKMSTADRKEMGLLSSDEQKKERDTKISKRDEREEKKIQDQVEQYLIHLGYERRSSDSILRGRPKSGWIIHLSPKGAKNNPILLDLIILSHSGRYLEHELKNANGKLSPEQEALVKYGASVSYSAEDACSFIKEWHDEQCVELTYNEEEM